MTGSGFMLIPTNRIIVKPDRSRSPVTRSVPDWARACFLPVTKTCLVVISVSSSPFQPAISLVFRLGNPCHVQWTDNGRRRNRTDFTPFYAIRRCVFFGASASIPTMGLTSFITGFVAPIFIIISPITSYADQTYSIHRTKSSAGFSLDIPLIMLVASMLR